MYDEFFNSFTLSLTEHLNTINIWSLLVDRFIGRLFEHYFSLLIPFGISIFNNFSRR